MQIKNITQHLHTNKKTFGKISARYTSQSNQTKLTKNTIKREMYNTEGVASPRYKSKKPAIHLNLPYIKRKYELHNKNFIIELSNDIRHELLHHLLDWCGTTNPNKHHNIMMKAGLY